MAINKNIEPHESVIRLVRKRSYMFTCGFKTTWEQHMTEAEKQGLSYQEAHEYWLNS